MGNIYNQYAKQDRTVEYAPGEETALSPQEKSRKD
jgi:hypothetical protein